MSPPLPVTRSTCGRAGRAFDAATVLEVLVVGVAEDVLALDTRQVERIGLADEEGQEDHELRVVDLATLLGRSPSSTPPRHVVVQTPHGLLALAVERVLGIEETPISALQPLPELIATIIDCSAIIGVVNRARRVEDGAQPIWLILDASRIAAERAEESIGN